MQLWSLDLKMHLSHNGRELCTRSCAGRFGRLCSAKARRSVKHAAISLEQDSTLTRRGFLWDFLALRAHEPSWQASLWVCAMRMLRVGMLAYSMPLFKTAVTRVFFSLPVVVAEIAASTPMCCEVFQHS